MSPIMESDTSFSQIALVLSITVSYPVAHSNGGIYKHTYTSKTITSLFDFNTMK